MDWIQVFTIIGVLGTIMFYLMNRIDSDVSKVDQKLDGWIKHSVAIQAEQSKRTDRLYEIIISMLKEKGR